MASNPNTIFAATALVLSGCAFGVLLGRWTSTPVTYASAPETPPPPDLAPVLGELQQIREALLAQGGERGERIEVPATEPGGNGGIASDSEAIRRLTESVERLIPALERSGSLVEGTSGSPRIGWRSNGHPSLASLSAWVQDRRNSAQGEPRPVDFMAELSKAYMGWSREDLFERYGAPSAMRPVEHGVQFVYEFGPGQKDRGVTFLVAEGLVTSVWLE